MYTMFTNKEGRGLPILQSVIMKINTIPSELKSVEELRKYLQIGEKELAYITRYRIHRYNITNIPKKRGGFRTIMIPESRLKHIQRKIQSLLEKVYIPRKPVHGFTKNRNAITNANAHVARPFILNIDLKNYFGTITSNRVKGMLIKIGIPTIVAENICNITTLFNQLPQGAPTSPILANMVTFKMDRELTTFAKNNNYRYTRYADDITFSSYTEPKALFNETTPPSGLIKKENLSQTLTGIIASNSFLINEEKLRYSGKGAKKEVTGLIINEFTNVRRTFIRDIRASIYKIEKMGIKNAEADFCIRYKRPVNLQKMLYGKLEWLTQVRSRSFSAYRTLAGRYNKLFPSNTIKILPKIEEIAREAIYVIEWDEGNSGENFSQGTAFFLKDVGLVTAHHCLKEMSTQWAEVYKAHKPNAKYKAKFSKIKCEHRDLAILEHNIPNENDFYLSPAETNVKAKDSVIALGFPSFGLGDELSERTGSITQVIRKSAVKLLDLSQNLDDGMSGGPVVNERYEVVGIVHKGGRTETRQLAVSIAELFSLINEQKTE